MVALVVPVPKLELIYDLLSLPVEPVWYHETNYMVDHQPQKIST